MNHGVKERYPLVKYNRMSVLSKSPSPLASGGPEDGNIKTVVEERIDEQGRAVRITRKIRMRRITESVPAVVAERRIWKKYGESSKDRAGPNLATTILGEPVFLKLALDRNFDQEAAQGEKADSVVETKSVVCQYCQGSHWSVRCPYKATFANIKSEREKEKKRHYYLKGRSSNRNLKRFLEHPPSRGNMFHLRCVAEKDKFPQCPPSRCLGVNPAMPSVLAIWLV